MFSSPDNDDPRPEAPEVVWPARLPVQHGDGLAQPHHLLALLLNLKVKLVISLSVTVPILHLGYEVTMLRQEVILNVLE